ncbi:minor capsid protein [Streptomyces sp. L2]|uniref:minor capsid protein n=1 Tax=Streptomyces sp. L2 TaxID=2162665 RepID=UPI001011B2BF|nr:minor capsid protein [Streptomyces sp. L2]
MSHDSDLLQGIAERLDTAGVGVYDPDSALSADGTGIVLGKVPDGPDRVLGLTLYPVTDDDSTDSVTGVQARMRAGVNPLDVIALADAVFDVLHNARSYTVHGVWVEVSWRNSQSWIGQDTSGRQEIAANYYFRTVRSGTHLNP